MYGWFKELKSKVFAYVRELDGLLTKINDNVAATRAINEENDRLRKQNEISFKRMNRAVNSLSDY